MNVPNYIYLYDRAVKKLNEMYCDGIKKFSYIDVMCILNEAKIEVEEELNGDCQEHRNG